MQFIVSGPESIGAHYVCRTNQPNPSTPPVAVYISSFLMLLSALSWHGFPPRAEAQTARVDTPQATNSFRPTETLGAGIDRISSESTDKVFAPSIVKQILSAGWQ